MGRGLHRYLDLDSVRGVRVLLSTNIGELAGGGSSRLFVVSSWTLVSELELVDSEFSIMNVDVSSTPKTVVYLGVLMDVSVPPRRMVYRTR